MENSSGPGVRHVFFFVWPYKKKEAPEMPPDIPLLVFKHQLVAVQVTPKQTTIASGFQGVSSRFLAFSTGFQVCCSIGDDRFFIFFRFLPVFRGFHPNIFHFNKKSPGQSRLEAARVVLGLIANSATKHNRREKSVCLKENVLYPIPHVLDPRLLTCCSCCCCCCCCWFPSSDSLVLKRETEDHFSVHV